VVLKGPSSLECGFLLRSSSVLEILVGMFGRDGCFQPTDHPVLCLSLLVFCLSIKQFASRFTDHLSASRITLCYEPALYSLQSGPGWHWDSLITFSFPDSSAGNESACNAGDLGLIPGSGRSSGEGKGYPPQYSGLENSMDCIVHGGHESQT